MKTKFKVGQVWENRLGGRLEIVRVSADDGTYAISAKDGDLDVLSYTDMGQFYLGCEDSRDLVKLVSEPGAPSIEPINGAVIDATRTEFIDRIVLQEFGKAVDGWSADDAEKIVRRAVSVRDELVRGAK